MNLNSLINKFTLPEKEIDRVYNHLSEKYSKNPDPWGLKVENTRKSLKIAGGLYRNYFNTRVFGKENITDENYIVVSNHSGQIPFDGMILSCAFLLELDQPRILRTMVERFVTTIPFFSSFVSESGGVLGDRSNCLELLKRKESVLVFPEGAKGIAKGTKEFYKLQNFTRGFYKLALKQNTKILPVSVVGAEEFYPLVHNFKSIAKLLKIPAFPMTPFFPLAGVAGALPLPSPVDVHIGKPIEVNQSLTGEYTDADIDHEVEKVKQEIKNLLDHGLKNRRPFWAAKLTKNFHETETQETQNNG